MWVIFGRKVKSERVPHGKVAERRCSSCGETAMFYERRVTTSVQLYFLDVFNYKHQRAMACGACGELFATDELGAPEDDRIAQEGTVAGALESAFQKASSVVRAGTSELLGRGRELLREEGSRTHEPSNVDDTVSEEDAALNARFAELERRALEKKKSET